MICPPESPLRHMVTFMETERSQMEGDQIQCLRGANKGRELGTQKLQREREVRYELSLGKGSQRRFSDLDKGHTLEEHPGDLGIFFMFIHVSQDLEQHAEQCQRLAPVGWRKLYKGLSLLPYGVLQ